MTENISLPRFYPNAHLWMAYINNFIKTGKRIRGMEFKSIWHFFAYINYWYLKKLEYWEKFHIKVRNIDTREIFDYVPPYRFTDTYRNRILYKFYDTLDMKLFYWITLTTPAYQGTDWLEYSVKLKEDTKYLWKRFYDYQRKYDGDFKFIRVYELTKKNTLHVHVAIYTKLTDSILKRNLVIQNEREQGGFIKAEKYTDHKRMGAVSKKGTVYDYWQTRTWSSWYDEGKITWKDEGYSRSSNKTLNYLMKYMSKNALVIHRALFTFFRIRTYSVSRSMKLRDFTTTKSDTFELVQKYHSLW